MGGLSGITDAMAAWISDPGEVAEAKQVVAAVEAGEAIEDRAIFDNAAVGIAFTRNRDFKRCNARWAEMFGYMVGEIVGRSASIIYNSDAAFEKLGREAKPVLQLGQAFLTDVMLRRKDGSLFWCHLYGRAVDPSYPRGGTVWIAEDITRGYELKQRERQASAELEAVFETAVLGIAVVRERTLVRCNARFEELFGYTAGEMVGQPTRLWYASEDDYEGIGAVAYAEFARGALHRREQMFRRRSGELFWGRLLGRAFAPDSPHEGSVWVLEDITERKRQEQALRAALDEQEMIFENAAVGILFERGRVVQRCNRRFENLFGYAPGELIGRVTLALYPDRERFEAHGRGAHAVLERGETYVCDCQVRRRDGSLFWIRSTAHRSHQNDGEPGIIWIVDDITERRAMQDALLHAHSDLEQRVEARTVELATTNAKLQAEVFERMQAEERIWHIAHHDPLTGLPNRSLLQDRLSQALVQADRNGRKAALLFIDLDRFKHVNDTLGHEIGDLLLRGVGARVCAAVRGADTVSRLGGDEFVVLLQDLAHPDDAAVVAEKILDHLQSPIEAHGLPLYAAASIGISVYPDDASDAPALMRNADAAMYQAKAVGRCFRFSNPRMNEEAARFFLLEQHLRDQMQTHFELHYQPLVDLASGRVRTVEALIRWNHPERGLIAPAEFIPGVEDTGLIIEIGNWVLREACRQAMAWSAEGRLAINVSVNLSPRQFASPVLIRDIEAALAETGLPPTRLELEFTEASLMHNTDEIQARLCALAGMGVRLAIDDFGIGYSSLNILRKFPINRMKIDRSFIADLSASRDDAAIVSAMFALARSLRLAVVAEGVETIEQVQLLKGFGCTIMQGFFFGRPLPPSQADAIFNPPGIRPRGGNQGVYSG